MRTKTYPFDVADFLKTDDDIHGFLREMAKTGSTDDFSQALNTAARAKGMTKIAKKWGCHGRAYTNRSQERLALALTRSMELFRLWGAA